MATVAALFWFVVDIAVFGVLAGMLAKNIVALGSEPSGADILKVILSFGVGIILVRVLVFVPMLVSWFAVGIKRLHDRDQSGWWILLFYFGPAVASGLGHNSGSVALTLVMALVSIGITVWCSSCSRVCAERADHNQYGSDPLGGNVMAAPSQARETLTSSCPAKAGCRVG